MELKNIQKEVNKLKEKQQERLEMAYRKDERIKVIQEVLHKKLMFEHREDIPDFKDKWCLLIERLNEVKPNSSSK